MTIEGYLFTRKVIAHTTIVTLIFQLLWLCAFHFNVVMHNLFIGLCVAITFNYAALLWSQTAYSLNRSSRIKNTVDAEDIKRVRQALNDEYQSLGNEAYFAVLQIASMILIIVQLYLIG